MRATIEGGPWWKAVFSGARSRRLGGVVIAAALAGFGCDDDGSGSVDGGRDAVADVPVSDAGATNDVSGDVACVFPGTQAPPYGPSALHPPQGATFVTRVHAVGSQIYVCQAGATAGIYAFAFKEPQATLRDERCMAAGTHYAGPTWQASDGSKVVGARVADAAVSGAIPLLLLRATQNMGAGIFADVTWIQRLDTMGGVTPTSGCDAANVGKEVAVPYSSTYYFYKGAPAPDAGTDAGDAGAGDAGVDDAPAGETNPG